MIFSLSWHHYIRTERQVTSSNGKVDDFYLAHLLSISEPGMTMVIFWWSWMPTISSASYEYEPKDIHSST